MPRNRAPILCSNARLLSSIACLAVLASLPSPPLAAATPNIVFILVDDQGYYDLGCYGATEFKTPNIDALAARGIRFTDYYAAAPICSPSRAGLLTGCYPRRVGLATWVQRADTPLGIHPDELTIAELLQSHGYATACIGKWHLGFHEPFLPQNQGFDHYFGLLHNLDPVETVYFDKAGGVPLLRGREVVKRPVDPAELSRLYTDEAIRFIGEHRQRPFFVYLPHTMLHVPLGVSREFQGKSNFGEYGDASQELDFHIGRLCDALDRFGVADNTIIVYASDNGRGPGRNDQQPLRGNKLTTYEAGLRVPCLVAGPGIRKNHVSSDVVTAMDWYPTLATLAGVKVPLEQILDGRDLSRLLSGPTDEATTVGGDSINADLPLRRTWQPSGEWQREFTREQYLNAFFYHGAEGQLAAVRSGQWKLFLTPSLQLFDLQSDPGETRPLRDPRVSRRLRGMAVTFQEEMTRDARPPGRID
jgi:arylsulfatase A-like enzyme